MISEINQINRDEISLKELILKIKEWVPFLKSKWKIIFLFSFIGANIGFAVAYFDKPTYKAVLTFAMEDDKGGGGGGLSGALGLASSFGIDIGGGSGGGAFAASNLTELMKSRLIVEKVLLNPIYINGKKTTLAEYFIEINKLRENWLKKPDLKTIHFFPEIERNKYSIQQDSILGVFHKILIAKNNLIIMQKDKKVTILSIEVNSKHELFSKLFCENLAKETSNFYIETKSKKARINLDALQKQADSVRSELISAIGGLAVETDNVYNLNPALITKTTPSKKRQFDVQANTAILTQLVTQLEIAKVGLRKETPLIQLIDKPMFPLEKEKIEKLDALIIGAVIGGFLSILFFIFQRTIRKIML
jgi:hypothetical protein